MFQLEDFEKAEKVVSEVTLETKLVYSEFLSAQTKNQVYLAVRLAICRLALGEEDPCPLILDDVLLTFDDTRAKRALRLLQDLAGGRQILMFTCSRREEKLLREIREEENACLPQ